MKPKKVVLPLLLIVFIIFGTTCKKKIANYPVDLAGVWTCNHSECAWMKLEIQKNGKGNYGPTKHCRGTLAHIDGKVKFTDENLYIGAAKFKFLSKPIYSNPEDSVTLTYTYVRVHYTAKMTIKESSLRGGQTYTFYKIKDY